MPRSKHAGSALDKLFGDRSEGDGAGCGRPRKAATKLEKLGITTLTREVEEAPRARTTSNRFEYRGFRLGKKKGSNRYYIVLYAQELASNVCETLGTSDLAEAKDRLIDRVHSLGRPAYGGAEDTPLALAIHFFLQEERNARSWGRTASTANLALSKVAPEVTILQFRDGVQKRIIKALAQGVRTERGLAVSSTANIMNFYRRVMLWSFQEDANTDRLCAREPPMVMTSESRIADYLEVPPPTPRNGHGTFQQLAMFLRECRDDTHLVRWMLFTLAFGTRAYASARVHSDQYDDRAETFSVLRKGEVPKRNKVKPTLPVPPSLVAELACWEDGVWVDIDDDHISSAMASFAARHELDVDFIPSSLKDLLKTHFNHAHDYFSIPEVPKQEAKMWLGHIKKDIHEGYGQFHGRFLYRARSAVEVLLRYVDDQSGGVLFSAARKAGSLPAKPVVYVPEARLGDYLIDDGSRAGRKLLFGDEG